MIGRIYTDPGRRARRKCPGRPRQFVRVLTRWQGRGPRNVLVEPVVPWLGVGWGDQWFKDEQGRWWRPGGKPYVRPFRGLRRVP